MRASRNFALIGAAGYIAPRHMRAVADTGNRLVAAFDPSDSVGILDSYFPDAHFFTQFERFDRHIDKLRRSRSAEKIDFISVCSPNYLHDSHTRFGLRAGANVICEKPLVLNPWNIAALQEIEEDTGQRVYTILQLRLHPSITAARDKILNIDRSHRFEFDLTYITSRGNWYHQSWKGDDKKSGGIATNIGIHFFDMLHYLFGQALKNRLHLREPRRAAGFLEFERARVRWFLSIDANDLPTEVVAKKVRTYRSMKIDGREIEFSGGFTDLHTLSYQAILEGRGFALEESRAAITTVAALREMAVTPSDGDLHPRAEAYLSRPICEYDDADF